MPFSATHNDLSGRFGIDTSLSAFRVWLIAGSFVSAGLIPSLIYGVLLGQWGTNLVWGSVYGLGWCLAAYFADVRGIAALLAFLWSGFAVPALLYVASGWLWNTCGEHTKRWAMILLFVSLAADIPAEAISWIDQQVIHLPDLMLHITTMY
ncbi:hypothetical protein [Sphingobium yanoikuyae]|uniref:Uncharacterized protein n=1 Tax=Sphingobium yanoikuyae TaxID=13690 RepID=A0A291MUV3_SPHYA|nr:hypothetical protein [Sphingobium yanoikuyae]ATI78889.1 hypothetical protein A6768_01990 [Sphingobium yanoikuyae]RSU80346.1 hypothetical protein BRX37_01545 [Sphingomonas sp. S-NIH.Pt3_0716]